MEQILFYIVTISGFSGLLLGLYILLVPVLQRRGITLPFLDRDARDEDDFELEDEDVDIDARQFGATSFSARRGSLLERLPRRAAPTAPSDAAEEDEETEEEDEEDEELIGDLDLWKERAEVEAEEVDEFEGDELAALTFDAEVDPVLEELAVDGLDDEADEDEEEDEDGEEDDDEYEDEEEEEPEAPVVQVVSVGGGNEDMLALFGEGTDVIKEVEAWRADLPEATIEDLLAEARELRALLKPRSSG